LTIFHTSWIIGEPLSEMRRGCWVSEYQALPDLDANAVAIQHIKLENEGWDRDVSVTEPTGPS
jgi:hypothetical protein